MKQENQKPAAPKTIVQMNGHFSKAGVYTTPKISGFIFATQIKEKFIVDMDGTAVSFPKGSWIVKMRINETTGEIEPLPLPHDGLPKVQPKNYILIPYTNEQFIKLFMPYQGAQKS